MNRIYTVQTGDTLWAISIKHYGVGSKYILIINANPILKERSAKGTIAADGAPVIYTGDKLNIPPETDDIVNLPAAKTAPDKIDNPDEEALILKIGSDYFRFPTGWSLTNQLETLDTVTITAPNIDNDIYKATFVDFEYREAQVYLGQDLFFNGIMIAPKTDVSPESRNLSITLYPSCGVMNDCSLPFSKFPLEKENQNLKQWAKFLTSAHGVGLDFEGDPGKPFEKIGMKPTDKSLAFLIGLAKKRGFRVTNSINGNLRVFKPAVSKSVGVYRESELPFISCTPNFDYQKYYSEITGLSQETEKVKADSYIWKNPFSGESNRPINLTLSNVAEGEIRTAVESAAARMFGDSCGYTLKIETIKNQIGSYLSAGQTLTAYSPNSSILKEYDFLIKTAVLSKEPSGFSSVLNLVIPGAVTGELPESVPWQA